MGNKVKVVRDDSTFYFACFLCGVTVYSTICIHTSVNSIQPGTLISFSMLYKYYRHIMQEESGSIEVRNIYKFVQVSPFPGRRVSYWPFWPFMAPFTCDSAASALRRSPSLRDLNGPPPGVLAPDMTDDARERTFITSGLQ